MKVKIKPYFVWLADTYILGPCVSFDERETRIGLSLIKFEIGLAFDSERLWRFGCSGCGTIGYAMTDELPPGWEKRYRPDLTYSFMCAKCHGKVGPDEDYVVTDENREQAIDEIIGQLTDREDNDIQVKAIRDYANRLLDESEPFSKYDLSASVAAYSDGLSDARQIGGGP